MKLIHFALLPFLLISCQKSEPETAPASEWITLFNGNTFEGWKGYNIDGIPPKWGIEDGIMYVSKEGNEPGKSTGFGRSIITTEEFENFELELEYRISPGGNSGVMYHIIESPNYDDDYDTGPEFQLIDNDYYRDRISAKQLTASNYDVLAPDSLDLNPAGEWNQIKLIYVNGLVEHWMNGQKVLEFTEGSNEWQEAVNNSKWVNGEFPDWGTSTKGHISLQDHGDFVEFKNIRIRRLE